MSSTSATAPSRINSPSRTPSVAWSRSETRWSVVAAVEARESLLEIGGDRGQLTLRLHRFDTLAQASNDTERVGAARIDAVAERVEA